VNSPIICVNALDYLMHSPENLVNAVYLVFKFDRSRKKSVTVPTVTSKSSERAAKRQRGGESAFGSARYNLEISICVVNVT